MELDAKILLTGANGLLGHGVEYALRNHGYCNLICPNHKDVNILDKKIINDFFSIHKPKYVFHLASLVYGVCGNMKNQLYSLEINTLINQHLFLACQKYSVKKIFFAGTVASYGFPYYKLPLTEKNFLYGMPHQCEYGYAMAKRHALTYLEILRREYNIDYCYGIFTNLYGPHDRFNINNGHVISSLIKKAAMALQNNADSCLRVWGKPETSRDFMYNYDAGAAALHAFLNYNGLINIATGVEITMKQVAETINNSYQKLLKIKWDITAPIGISNRCVDISLLRSLGYHSTYNFKKTIAQTIDWYKQNITKIRK